MGNTGRCPRCNEFLIAEQYASHVCDIRFKGVKEIMIDWITDGTTDENNDLVKIAKGFDGILYRLVLCKHNPPHNVVSRWLTRKDMSREDTSTIIRNIYILLPQVTF